MWNDQQRSLRSSPMPTEAGSPSSGHPSGIGRGSSSGATPEEMFVSWHCSHNTVPTHSVLVTTEAAWPSKSRAKASSTT